MGSSDQKFDALPLVLLRLALFTVKHRFFLLLDLALTLNTCTEGMARITFSTFVSEVQHHANFIVSGSILPP